MFWFNFLPNRFINSLWVIWWHIVSKSMPKYFQGNYRHLVGVVALFLQRAGKDFYFKYYKPIYCWCPSRVIKELLHSSWHGMLGGIADFSLENGLGGLVYICCGKNRSCFPLEPTMLLMDTALRRMFDFQATWKPSALPISTSFI